MRNKGITLIALIVTIIILLVLAGVGITMLMGDNGILNKANIAKKESEFSNEIEQNRLGSYNEMMNSYTTRSGETTAEQIAQLQSEVQTLKTQVEAIGTMGTGSYTISIADRTWVESTFNLPAGKYIVTAVIVDPSSAKAENIWHVCTIFGQSGQASMAEYNETVFNGYTQISNVFSGDTSFDCKLSLYHNYGSTQSFTVRYNYIKIK